MDQDTDIGSVFNGEWRDAVAQATSLELWGLTYRDQESVGRLAGYRTTGCAAVLDAEELETYRSLVFSPGASRTDLISRVPFRPRFGLVFRAEDSQTVLLVDTASSKWGCVRDETPRCADLNLDFPGVATLLSLQNRLSSAKSSP